MLSPGLHYRRVPRELVENRRYRERLLSAALSSKEWQKQLMEKCAEDIVFYINSFVWQMNPTKGEGDRVGPMVLWRFQEEALLGRPETTGKKGILWCYENQEPMVWEKSREMGATWLAMIVPDWLCRFHEHNQALSISKSMDAVDSKSMNSLFPKLKFVNERLPEWMRVGFDATKRGFLGYEETHSEHVGEASSARAGVGGRGGWVTADEAAEIEELKELREKLASTAPFRVFISTHLGTGNEFFTLCQDESFVKLQFHWTQHPDKNKGLYSYDTAGGGLKFWRYDEELDDLVEIPGPVDKCLEGYVYDLTGKPTGGPWPGIRSPWYDKKAKEIGDDRAVAQQLDINPTGSDSQFYDPVVIRELKAKHARAPYYECELEYDKETAQPVKLVEVAGGRIKLWCELRDGKPVLSRYGAGADVAMGSGATSSCLSIANGGTGEKVLEFKDAHIQPFEFAVLAVALCRLFCDEDGIGAKLAWENHGPGATFGGRVWDKLGYGQVWINENEQVVDKPRTRKPGWNPSKENRLSEHMQYKAALRSGEYLNRSWGALDETLAFKHDGKGSVEHAKFANKSDPAAARENHGDVVIADVLSYKMIRGLMLQKRQQAPDEETLDPTCLMGRINLAKMAEREAKEAEVWVRH